MLSDLKYACRNLRRALGAQEASLVRLVLGEGLGMTLGGVAAGIAGAIALTRVIQTLLFQVSPTDPWIMTGIAAMLTLLAAGACYVPARRATRVDPMAALRAE